MTKAMRFPLGLALAGGVSACTGGAVGTAELGSYDPLTLNYVASKGALYTQVIGNPFDAPKAELDGAVMGSMTGAHFGQTLRFSTELDPDSTSPYRVVVMFNPAKGIGGHNLCQGAAQGATQGATGQGALGPVRVVAAFCAGDSRETSVSGRLPGATGPDDPALRGLIRRMTAELFPPKNPNLIDGANDFDI